MLAQHVLYRIYSDYVYILDMRTAKSYVFDGIAVDLIDFAAQWETVDAHALAAHVAGLYDIADSAAVQEDVQWFLDELESSRLLRTAASGGVLRPEAQEGR